MGTERAGRGTSNEGGSSSTFWNRLLFGAEAGGTALALAAFQKRYSKSSPGMTAPFGLDLALIVAAGAGVVALNSRPSRADHFAAVGTGAIALFGAKFGASAISSKPSELVEATVEPGLVPLRPVSG